MTQDLKNRIGIFDEISADIGRTKSFTRPSSLICSSKISDEDWRHLQNSANLYMNKCLPNNSFITDENELLETFAQNKDSIKNITPNGLIVPKRHTVLEYNLLVNAVARIINSAGIGDWITSWHIPLNLRIKHNEINEENMKRHHPTEHIHSDSWAGESADSVTVMIPIFGDTDHNRVTYYDPPDNFEDSWLGPLPSYADGAEIASRYKKLDFVPKKQHLILADFSTLHASHRDAGASHRVSIDTTFVPVRKYKGGDGETIHPWRENERATHKVLSSLGETHLFHFPDSVDQQVDSQGGFKHPTNLVVKELE